MHIREKGGEWKLYEYELFIRICGECMFRLTIQVESEVEGNFEFELILVMEKVLNNNS